MKNHAAAAMLRAVLMLSTAVLLLLSNLYIVATPGFIEYEYARAGFPPSDSYEAPERLALANATLHYLRSNKSADSLRDLRSDGHAVYNAREIKHLEDVKAVMRAAFCLHTACALVFLTGMAWAWRKRQARLAVLRAVRQGSILLLVFLTAIGLLAYTSFDLFFVAFHRVFFAGDSWLFAPSDTLIQLFPVQFWMDTTWTLAILAIAEAMAVGSIAHALFRREQKTLYPS